MRWLRIIIVAGDLENQQLYTDVRLIIAKKFVLIHRAHCLGFDSNKQRFNKTNAELRCKSIYQITKQFFIVVYTFKDIFINILILTHLKYYKLHYTSSIEKKTSQHELTRI